MGMGVDFYAFAKKLKTPVLVKFLHESIDDQLGDKQIDIKNFVRETGWSDQECQVALKSIQSFYCDCIFKGKFELNIPELNENVYEAIKSCYDLRHGEIFNHLVRQSIIKQDYKLADNFDWKIKWIIGSSKLASLREPVLQVSLYCVEKGDSGEKNQKKTVNVEVTLEKLDKLINDLEKVKEQLS